MDQKDAGRATTAAHFSPSFVITAVAKTSDQDLRLFYGDRGFISFNSFSAPDGSLCYRDPSDGRRLTVAEQGNVPKDTFVTIRWVIGVDESRVEVNGVERAAFKGDYAHLSGGVGVGTYGATVVTLRSLTITPGGAR
jgi:hypothetical protein